MWAMKKSSKILLILALLLLPLLVDQILNSKQSRLDARQDQLVRDYECYPLSSCVADFDGDGIPAKFYPVLTQAVSGQLVVIEGGHEVLRLSYDHTDNSLRTHAAIHKEKNKSRLLIYDGTTSGEKGRAAFEWNGNRLVEVTPTEAENEIISAMAAHDDTGGRNDRAFRDLVRMISLVAVYLVLSFILLAVVLIRRGKRIGSDPGEPKTAF